jgi:hypothetical protein
VQISRKGGYEKRRLSIQALIQPWIHRHDVDAPGASSQLVIFNKRTRSSQEFGVDADAKQQAQQTDFAEF